MPRQARIDAPGALQHIIIRGIEKRAIFKGDHDREDFTDRLEKLLKETQTACYAWALMPNHVHLLMRTGAAPIATVMRRLLTGYAVSFNRRYHRHGHLFQNRYKSILCDEESYLKQLVGYIHLNPFRAGIVPTLDALESYPFSGHGALTGISDIAWQDTRYVLAFFGGDVSEARERYVQHVTKWAAKGRRPELTGGGLIRSAGGWRTVKAAHEAGIRLTSDERILGGSDFVEKTIARVGEDYDRKTKLKAAGIDLEALLNAVCIHLEVDPAAISRSSRIPAISQARGLASYVAVNALGIAGAEVARRLNVDRSAVSRAIMRVKKDPSLKKNVYDVLSRVKRSI